MKAIVAMTPERVIGNEGGMPWHLPGDLAFFKRTTLGNTVVMGRTTYESIGKPLPGRYNVVLTHNKDWEAADEVAVIHSPDELNTLPIKGELFILGGTQIFSLFLDQIDVLYVTHIYHSYPGDTFFPDFSEQFSEPEILEVHPEFEFRKYLRKV